MATRGDLQKALEDALYSFGYDVPADRGRRIAEAVATELGPVIPCPRCGGEGYDNVFLDGDIPRHCGADVSYRGN